MNKKVLIYKDFRGATGAVLARNIDAIWAVEDGDLYDGDTYTPGTRSVIHTAHSCLESSESAEELIARWEKLLPVHG